MTTPTPDDPSFSDLSSFTRATRLTGVSGSRSGTVVATLRRIDEAGAAFIDRLVSVEAPGRSGGPAASSSLTRGGGSATLLAVGERGEVYFTREDPSAEEKGDAVWMLPPRGEAREILRHRGGVESLAATGGGLVLVLGLAPGADTVEDSDARLKARSDAKVSAVLHDDYPIRYWDHDLGPARRRLFTAPLPDLAGVDDAPLPLAPVDLPEAPADADQWDLGDVLPAPDGSLAVIAMKARTRIDTTSQTWAVTLNGSGGPRLLAADPAADMTPLAVSPDGTWALVDRELPPLPGQAAEDTLWRVDLATGERTRVAGAFDDAVSEVTIGDDQSVWFCAPRRGRGGVYRAESDGTATLVTPDDECAYSSLTWSGGRLVALRSSIAQAPQVVFLDPGPADRGQAAITGVPGLAPDLELPGELTEVAAQAQDGTPLRAWLALPDAEGPHPLVVFAHGGPWGTWNDWTWRWNPWPFVARGYAVLLPDPGISLGYGRAMTARGHDAIGDAPVSDIMALADAAVARPDVDASRQGFAGGSYGGYLANWTAGHAGTRFRCVVTHAGLWDVGAMAATTDNGSWYRWMTAPVDGGAPQARQWSPHRAAADIRVPMLVIHGDRDYRVPFAQALELWADLQRLSPQLGHRFLYFPDEGHWILKPGNAQVWYETFLAFLDTHLRGRAFDRPDLLG
jgi:dipeptidyl aminopeptidase/acylaminoacyl peptidase